MCGALARWMHLAWWVVRPVVVLLVLYLVCQYFKLPIVWEVCRAAYLIYLAIDFFSLFRKK